MMPVKLPKERGNVKLPVMLFQDCVVTGDCVLPFVDMWTLIYCIVDFVVDASVSVHASFLLLCQLAPLLCHAPALCVAREGRRNSTAQHD